MGQLTNYLEGVYLYLIFYAKTNQIYKQTEYLEVQNKAIKSLEKMNTITRGEHLLFKRTRPF